MSVENLGVERNTHAQCMSFVNICYRGAQCRRCVKLGC